MAVPPCQSAPASPKSAGDACIRNPPKDVLTVPKQKGCAFVLGNHSCLSYCCRGYILVSLNSNLYSQVRHLQEVSSVSRG